MKDSNTTVTSEIGTTFNFGTNTSKHPWSHENRFDNASGSIHNAEFTRTLMSDRYLSLTDDQTPGE